MSEKQIKGLSTPEVIASREKYGDNVLTPPKRESVWKLFTGKFNDPIIKILLVAAGLSLIIAFLDGHFAETIGIIFSILLATGVSFWFEYDAKRRFEILNTVNDDTPVKVIRDGQVGEIPKRDVVVGDVVVLASGDEVPADGELAEAVSMKINESSLTGEPVISKTTVEADFKADATYPSNHALRGTNVVEGYGTMVVQAVGDATEYGQVAEQATVENKDKTPLDKQLGRLSELLGKIGGGLAVFIFGALVIKGIFFDKTLVEGGWLHITKELLEYFMVAVAIMVMAVPEGLPMSITLSLAMSMKRMLKTNNLVRKMHACETMGAVTVICTDKTGTLTRNEMRVDEWKNYMDVPPGIFYESIAANSTAYLDKNGKVIGNPTEGALLLWLREQGADYEAVRSQAKIVDQITFSTERKYMATLVESGVDGRRRLYVKGAPEIVMKLSDTGGYKDEAAKLLGEYQNKAMRTLGFAMAECDTDTCGEAMKELRFAGIAAISDPVRDDVPEAVRECLEAGVKVKIVTGDTPATTKEIARRIGLWDDNRDGEANHITGVEFASLSDEELLDRVQALKIMSRARPLDKQRLVRLLQELDEVVAVTGDGTNDAPALNLANVGLSMGTGTSVAKEASDITLLDDSFKSIATAVMWGRSLYKNIQRFVLFQLTVNFVAMVVVFFGSLFGNNLPIPLTVTQILWVNLIMDTFAAMALASLPPDPNVMRERPRKPSDFIINRAMINRIVWIGSPMIVLLLFMYEYYIELDLAYNLSVFFSVFVFFHVWNLFNAKAFSSGRSAFANMAGSKGFMAILLVILVGQIMIVTFGGSAFRTVPMRWDDWLRIIAYTSGVMIVGEIIGFITRLREKSK